MKFYFFIKRTLYDTFACLIQKTFLIFAQKVQYNTLLDMKNQEVMKLQRKALGITQQDLADMSEIAILCFYQYASRRSKQKDSLQKLAIG